MVYQLNINKILRIIYEDLTKCIVYHASINVFFMIYVLEFILPIYNYFLIIWFNYNFNINHNNNFLLLLV